MSDEPTYITLSETIGISAGYHRLRPMTRLRKVSSGVFAPEFLHPDGEYRTTPAGRVETSPAASLKLSSGSETSTGSNPGPGPFSAGAL